MNNNYYVNGSTVRQMEAMPVRQPVKRPDRKQVEEQKEKRHGTQTGQIIKAVKAPLHEPDHGAKQTGKASQNKVGVGELFFQAFDQLPQAQKGKAARCLGKDQHYQALRGENAKQKITGKVEHQQGGNAKITVVMPLVKGPIPQGVDVGALHGIVRIL